MFSARLLAAAVLVGLCATISAAPYEDELLLIEIPTGFQGPIRGEHSDSGVALATVAYVKPGPAGSRTLLQLTQVQLGSKLASLDKHKLGVAADKYLLQFLGSVERRRTDFQVSTPTRIELDGLPAARAAWKGAVPGERLSGTMYCVVVGSRVVIFHTQQAEGGMPEHTAEAIRAIESVRFKHDG